MKFPGKPILLLCGLVLISYIGMCIVEATISPAHTSPQQASSLCEIHLYMRFRCFYFGLNPAEPQASIIKDSWCVVGRVLVPRYSLCVDHLLGDAELTNDMPYTTVLLVIVSAYIFKECRPYHK